MFKNRLVILLETKCFSICCRNCTQMPYFNPPKAKGESIYHYRVDRCQEQPQRGCLVCLYKLPAGDIPNNPFVFIQKRVKWYFWGLNSIDLFLMATDDVLNLFLNVHPPQFLQGSLSKGARRRIHIF